MGLLGCSTGRAIAAVPAAPAKPVLLYDWYRGFIQLLIDSHAQVFMGKVVAFDETASELTLILGAFVGVAALAGGFMNVNFMLAGSASGKPRPAHPRDRPDPRLEDRGVHRTRPLPGPIFGTPWKAPKTDRLLFCIARR